MYTYIWIEGWENLQEFCKKRLCASSKRLLAQRICRKRFVTLRL